MIRRNSARAALDGSVDVHVEIDGGGWHVVWFDRVTEATARWYAGRATGDPRQACEERAMGAIPLPEQFRVEGL